MGDIGMAPSTLVTSASPLPSGSAVATKLEAFARLSADDRAALGAIISGVRYVEARQDLIREGDQPKSVHLVLEGWACRYKHLPDGRRQIVNFLVAGDFCDLNMHILEAMDHSIGAISRLKVAVISPEAMDALTAGRPGITRALWWHELVTAAIEREWTLNLGQRSAYQRLGHLLIELYVRLRIVGLGHGGRCDWPLTQNDLADATGLTAVHVNRTLQELRRDGLIELARKQLHILDLQRLMRVSMFNPYYLHFDREGRHFDIGA
jgi:CRP-like cAMP-binding protein